MRSENRWLAGGSRRPGFPVQLPTFSGTGTMPGVDLDSNASLLELMEEEGSRAELEDPV